MAKQVVSDPDGEKLTAIINEAGEQSVIVTERHAIVVTVKHEALDDAVPIKIEEKLRNLGFVFLGESWNTPRTSFIREWLH